MQFTLSWLLEYLETSASLDEILKTLTSIGLEVESCSNNSHLQDFIVVKILETAPHPNADRLKVCKVRCAGEDLQIVCGASNAVADMITVLAPVGSTLPDGTKIKNAKIRGVESIGMLCSAQELMINYFKNDGIVDLPEDYEVGDRFFSDDTIIVISVTPNRGDCLGVYGIARDLAAAGLGSLKPLNSNFNFSTKKSVIGLTVKDGSSFVSGRYIENIKNTESPRWLRERLMAAGMRPISAIVDVTNYVMLSFNRPLHAYNADKVNKNLIFSPSSPTKFVALNEVEYILPFNSTIITDDSGDIHGVAGIIGAKCSACDLETKNILLESAWFEPVKISNASRDLNLSTGASQRFERMVDPEFTIEGLNLATVLILQLCGGTTYEVCTAGQLPQPKSMVQFDSLSVAKIGNVEISDEIIGTTLQDIGCEITQRNKKLWTVKLPSWRSDILQTLDLPEEVLRLYGYDKIKEEQFFPSVMELPRNEHDQLRMVMVNQGLDEVISWSFVDSSIMSHFGFNPIIISNPITEHHDAMRPSIIPSLLQITADNLAHHVENIAIFELGPIYNQVGQHDYSICGARTGMNCPRNLYKKERPVDVFDVKSDFLAALAMLNIPKDLLITKKCSRQYYHPGKSGAIYYAEHLLGFFGEIHPKITEFYDIKAPVVCFEIFLSEIPIIDKVPHNFTENRYQPVKRDFAFLFNNTVEVGIIQQEIKNSNPLITEVTVFDVYHGDKIEQDKVSVAFSVVIQSHEGTLTDKDINSVTSSVLQVAKRHHGVLRG